MTRPNSLAPIVLVFVCLIGYTLPWLVNRSAGLTMGAYDLAEWASLHPQVHFESDLLLTPLLLRLPLVFIGIAIVFTGRHFRDYFYFRLILCLGIALYLLPPLEFFISPGSDVNYLQEFVLAVILCAIGIIGLFVQIRSKWRQNVVAASLFSGLLCSIWGMIEIADLMNGFALYPQLGMGIVLIVAAFVLMLISALLTNRAAQRLL